MDRRTRRKEITRRKLLDSGKALFSMHGLFGTRVEDITERADIAKGAFYNYFSSKEDLAAELLQEAAGVFEVSYLSTVIQTDGVEGVLRSLVRQLNQFFEDKPDYALLLHQSRGLGHG